jgi:translation initiation factor IF-2
MPCDPGETGPPPRFGLGPCPAGAPPRPRGGRRSAVPGSAGLTRRRSTFRSTARAATTSGSCTGATMAPMRRIASPARRASADRMSAIRCSTRASASRSIRSRNRSSTRPGAAGSVVPSSLRAHRGPGPPLPPCRRDGGADAPRVRRRPAVGEPFDELDERGDCRESRIQRPWKAGCGPGGPREEWACGCPVSPSSKTARGAAFAASGTGGRGAGPEARTIAAAPPPGCGPPAGRHDDEGGTNALAGRSHGGPGAVGGGVRGGVPRPWGASGTPAPTPNRGLVVQVAAERRPSLPVLRPSVPGDRSGGPPPQGRPPGPRTPGGGRGGDPDDDHPGRPAGSAPGPEGR